MARLKRTTICFTPDIEQALAEYQSHTREEMAVIVRDATRKYLDEKLADLRQKKLEKLELGMEDLDGDRT